MDTTATMFSLFQTYFIVVRNRKVRFKLLLVQSVKTRTISTCLVLQGKAMGITSLDDATKAALNDPEATYFSFDEDNGEVGCMHLLVHLPRCQTKSQLYMCRDQAGYQNASPKEM
eukprot:GHVT01021621.1.p2 GENE.GHVT01021621.1~~GHVT01021621.1.p2  ORF type:complete len:115 (+),score=1.13 GHVT01021621.1:369-713(+)